MHQNDGRKAFAIANEMEGMGSMGSGRIMAGGRCYVRLASLEKGKAEPGVTLQLPAQELELVSETIRQNITRRQIIEQLNSDAKNMAAVEEIEVALKSLLTAEYETQLKRQELEIQQIERRTGELREELGRRRAAKERVVDVQLGRTILEAQGLLGK